MEFINKIEVAGVVGAVNTSSVSGSKVARFSVMTENSSTSKDGGLMVECTWFSVCAFESGKITGLDKIQKGSKVHVLGRVRVRRYVDSDGNDRQCWEVVANELKLLEG